MLNELKNLLLDAVHAIGDLPDLLFRLATRPIAWGFAWIQGILHPDTRPRRNSMATVPKVRRNLAPLKQTLQRLSKGSRQGGQNSSKFLAQSGSSLRAKGQGIWNQTLRPLGKVTSTGLRTGFSLAAGRGGLLDSILLLRLARPLLPRRVRLVLLLALLFIARFLVLTRVRVGVDEVRNLDVAVGLQVGPKEPALLLGCRGLAVAHLSRSL